MSGHLSSEMFAEWLSGEGDADARAHLATCEVCCSELASFQAAMDDFRTGVRAWSDTQYRAAAVNAAEVGSSQPSSSWLHGWIPAAASTIALLLICLSVGLYLYRRAVPLATDQRTSITDAALWSQIDEQTSRTVSPAMDPLLGAVSFKSLSGSHRGIQQ